MSSFVDPLEEPLDQDRRADGPLDADVNDDLVDSADADQRAAEHGIDGTEETGGASEGEPLDPNTPVDNLE